MASTQKAVLLTEVGKPLVLVNDLPIPRPGPQQVQLKVSVAGLNPHDQKTRDMGLFVNDDLPKILASDIVGIVTKLGEGVSSIAVGERIVSQGSQFPGPPQNGLQEFAVADVGASSRIPDSITDDEAATLPTNIIAPLVALFDTLQIPAPWSGKSKNFDYANTTLLVVGGGSNCGKFGVQLAKLADIGKIVVVGGNEAELKGFGATHVLDRHGGYDVVLDRIIAVVGDNLVYAFDAIQPPEGQILTLNALSNHKKGVLARLLPLGPVDESRVQGKKAGFEVRDVFGSSHAKPDVSKRFWELVPGYLEAGKIKPIGYVAKQGLTAENVNEILDAYRDGKAVTKTHIHL
ncbi:putative alcohol dehydrogenase [Pseudomassariella vexata]|uniref:Putative alcohol dehydrogenase n=1 Tax=Pseudomassariella vexata TaxID=1141098 RepID=A0A1Y2DT37_9PEZI|nr:putative alcohol dehydrogenase [Pseudomassariella vexata]ORY62433.1 putative alcohol dehydrogenase [Pseudomassariella vexata]